MSRAEVVVVGAGAAGIGCALELRARGRQVLVVEALDRVGGRAWTTTVAGVPVDVGAQFVHAVEHGNPWAEIALARGVPVVAGPHRRKAYGDAPFDPGERFRSALAAAARAPAGASVADAVGADPLALAFAGPWLCGEEPSRMDAADLAEAFGGEDWLLPEGYGRLVASTAEGLAVRLATPVVGVVERPGGVVVETAAGTIQAEHVVVTVSTSALAAGAIAFDPPLPAGFRAALDGVPCGSQVKAALVLREGALADVPTQFAMRADADSGSPLLHVRPAGLRLVTCFWGGAAGRAVEALADGDAGALAVDALVSIFGTSAQDLVVATQVSRWAASPYFRGSYSNALPGRHGQRAVLRAPFAGRVHYAGEAAAPPGWQATVAGAWLSGRATARRITAQPT